MDINSEKLTYVLNSVENHSRQLAESINLVKETHEKASKDNVALLDTLGDLRTMADNVLDWAEAVWNELLRVADQCWAIANCPQQIRDVATPAFERLGFTIYGLPGSVVTDLSSVEVVARHRDPTCAKNTVLQTLQIGLLRNDGSIARRPKVTITSTEVAGVHGPEGEV